MPSESHPKTHWHKAVGAKISAPDFPHLKFLRRWCFSGPLLKATQAIEGAILQSQRLGLVKGWAAVRQKGFETLVIELTGLGPFNVHPKLIFWGMSVREYWPWKVQMDANKLLGEESAFLVDWSSRDLEWIQELNRIINSWDSWVNLNVRTIVPWRFSQWRCLKNGDTGREAGLCIAASHQGSIHMADPKRVSLLRILTALDGACWKQLWVFWMIRVHFSIERCCFPSSLTQFSKLLRQKTLRVPK